MQLLLGKGADVEAINNKQCCPLHSAINEGNAKVVEHFLMANAQKTTTIAPETLYSVFEFAMTACVHAAREPSIDIKGYKEIVGSLFSYGLFNRVHDRKKCMFVIAAIVVNEFEWVKSACTTFPHLVNFQQSDVDGKFTPLIMAAKENRPIIMKFLLKNGADVELSTNEGKTALLYACAEGYVNCVQLLLKYKAPINAVDLGRDVAFLAAVDGEHDAIIYILKEHRRLLQGKENLQGNFGVMNITQGRKI